MESQIIERWDKNKHKLEEYFATTKQSEYSDYGVIVCKIFELVINEDGYRKHEDFNVGKMTIIDDGDYQGTQIFIIPKNTYQPSASDYLVTDTYYGSCSGCDTLQSISDFDYDELPSRSQVKEYMALALHLVQKMHWLSDNKYD